MKKIPLGILFAILFSAVTVLASAQTNTDHTPRDGDRMHPGISGSEALILSVNDSARTVLIDPSAISFSDECDASAYIDTDTISYVQFATKHRFTLRGDTLSYIGYENRATDFRLDSPVNAAVFPLKDGDTVEDSWSGSMLLYGAMVLKHVKGESRSEVQGGWTLTDGTDSLRNATRLRWTLDMAYADPDSVTAAMPDSVASDMMSEMQVDAKALLSERLLTERTMWFAEDARYPVLTESRVSRILLDVSGEPTDTVPLDALAMHYPASYQQSDTGEEIIAQKPKKAPQGTGYGEYGDDEADTGHTLSVGEPEVTGETLTVTVSSQSGQTTATLTLFSDSGMRLTEPLEISVGIVPQTHAIPVPSGWTGVILLRVDTGEESYTRKTVI